MSRLYKAAWGSVWIKLYIIGSLAAFLLHSAESFRQIGFRPEDLALATPYNISLSLLWPLDAVKQFSNFKMAHGNYQEDVRLNADAIASNGEQAFGGAANPA